jgi:hypothetical protein
MWELLGPSGELIRSVSTSYVEQAGVAQVNAHAAQRPRFWPPLRQGRSYLHLLLAGGAADGSHVYVDPEEADRPPASVLVRGQVYRLVEQDPVDGVLAVYLAGEHTG